MVNCKIWSKIKGKGPWANYYKDFAKGIRTPRRREKFVRKQIGTVEVRGRQLKRADCVLALQEFWNERSGSAQNEPSKIFRVFKPHEYFPDSIDCIKIKRNN